MVNTIHINKNGLSFKCPDYYDCGNFQNSNEAHQSIVALSKNDRKCEIYVCMYREHTFEDIAKRNTNLLRVFLQTQGYENITENRKAPYCFNAFVNSDVGKIRTTILFNFDFKNVIMIVGNIVPWAHYDCINDMKIINDSILTEDEFKKKIFGVILWVMNLI